MVTTVPKKIWVVAAAGWLIGTYLIAASARLPQFVGVSIVGADSASAEQDRAASVTAAIGEAKLAETIGRDHLVTTADGSARLHAAVQVDGRAVTLASLESRGVERHNRVSELLVDGAPMSFPETVDVWVASWSRDGVPVVGWTDKADIRVDVVVEARTGKLLAANVGAYNPSAQPRPVAGPGEKYCQPIPDGLPGARFCYTSLAD